MKRVIQNLSEISAEMLVNYLYPELSERWKILNAGTFYRNYNRDVLGYDEETAELQVVRDGFLKLLPQGLLFQGGELGEKGRLADASEQESRMRLLRDLFQPFDAFAFRRQLTIERQVSALLEDKLEYVLEHYFHYDLKAEQNPYVKEVAVLLPFIHNMRGDLLLVRNLLASLFGCEVTLQRGRYSDTDNTRSWLPMVRYELLVDHLTTAEYDRQCKDLEPLIDFLQEWFIPFDVKCLVGIKWHHQPQAVSSNLVLDYNTEFGN